MIKFGKLRWKNLLSTGNVFTEVDLGAPGTTLVVGSNGGGKSTLTDALSFALYGKPFRKISKPQLVNSINRKDMVVECEFVITGKQYLIRRGLKPALFEIFVDGDMLDMEGKVADQQEYLEKNILRMNHRALMQVVVLGSASYVPFMELIASHRREVLEDLLDMKVLGVMMDLLKPRLTELNNAIKEADHKWALVFERVSMRQKFDEAVKQDVAARRKVYEDHIAELEKSAEELTTQGNAYYTKYTELETTIDDFNYEAAISPLKDVMTSNGNELTRVRTRLKFFATNPTCPHCEQTVDDGHRKAIEDELVEVEKSLVGIVAKQIEQISELRAGADKVSKTRADQADLRVKMTDIKTKIEHINRTIAADRKKMDEVTAGATVDLPELATLEAELEDINKSRLELNARRTTLGSIHTVLQDGGAKARIIGTYIPVINELINGFLKDLDFFVEFQLDSEFNESIKSRYRDEFTYSSFSEGEKMRINLAILFTWRAVARMKNSVATNVVIMDEIFDSSLDPAGAEELMRLLNRITGDSSVFIISHRSDQMSDKFGRVVKFSKVGNYSVKEDA